eukprot:SAG22_NODE_6243_length_881_cov_1.317136_2_plen_147_part_01
MWLVDGGGASPRPAVSPAPPAPSFSSLVGLHRGAERTDGATLWPRGDELRLVRLGPVQFSAIVWARARWPNGARATVGKHSSRHQRPLRRIERPQAAPPPCPPCPSPRIVGRVDWVVRRVAAAEVLCGAQRATLVTIAAAAAGPAGG